MMRESTILLALAALLLSTAALAADLPSSDPAVEEEAGGEAHQFPKIKTDAALHLGYRFIDIDGSREAAEYEYPEDSILFGGELRSANFPHRMHLDFDYRNKADYFGDAWYTYRDIFFIRATNSTVFHNLLNIDLDPTSPNVDIRDPGENYGLKTGMDQFYLRGKAPDFPLHVYGGGRLVRKSGDRQQRSLLGSGYFNNIVKSSQSRDIDFLTRNVKVGINSHLGPIEVDYAHGEKRFDVGDDSALYDDYTASGRTAGLYPHNLIADVDSAVDTLKVHTSHSGKIVATGTLRRTDNENQYSGAESQYWIGAGDITLMPMPLLSLFVDYRYKKSDFDNPDTVSITDLNDSTNTTTYPVRRSISSASNRASVIARYRPLGGLTLNLGYRFRDIHRKHADRWGVPTNSQEHTARISVRTRMSSSIHTDAEYIHREINDPAYNIQPDSSDEGRFSLTWLPTPRVSTLLSYDGARESREDLHTADAGAFAPGETLPDNREVRKHSILGNITYQVLDDLSLTASYAYLYYRIEQDIEYHDLAGTAFTDEDVTYRSKAQSLALDLYYAPHDLIGLSAGISHTMGQASFRANDPALVGPGPPDQRISTFSRTRTEQTDYSASCDVRLGRGFSSGIHYQYTDFDDDWENIYDDVTDGDAHILRVTLAKRW